LLGDFTWRPSADQQGTYPVTIRVTDSGSPPLSATKQFYDSVSAGHSFTDVKILPDGRVELTCAVIAARSISFIHGRGIAVAMAEPRSASDGGRGHDCDS
jgi:hypothetical protein